MNLSMNWLKDFVDTTGIDTKTFSKENAVLKVVMEAYAENAGDLDTLPVKIYYPTTA